jgi:hypothetical protein
MEGVLRFVDSDVHLRRVQTGSGSPLSIYNLAIGARSVLEGEGPGVYALT